MDTNYEEKNKIFLNSLYFYLSSPATVCVVKMILITTIHCSRQNVNVCSLKNAFNQIYINLAEGEVTLHLIVL